MKYVLLNVNNFHSSKKDKDYTVIQVLRDFYPRELKQGYIGKQYACELFLPEHCVGMFNDSHIGKEIDLIYSVRDGKAILDDVVLK